MRQTFSIFFILLILLNVMGYYGVFLGLQYKNDRDIALRLNENTYHESETIMIKVPLSIPYHIDDTDYNRVDGKIEHNGQTLRLVKQKLVQDTLFIVCMKDVQSNEIRKALSDYVKTFTDKPVHTNQSGKAAPCFIKDFLPTHLPIESVESGWSYTLTSVKITTGLIHSACIDISSPPPQS